MFYSELVKKACNIMFEVHKDDKDKGGYTGMSIWRRPICHQTRK